MEMHLYSGSRIFKYYVDGLKGPVQKGVDPVLAKIQFSLFYIYKKIAQFIG
jgi:hypothetical protein